MIKVKIPGIIVNISRVINKSDYSYKQLNIKVSGFRPGINRQLTADKIYDINVVNDKIKMLDNMTPGDKVIALCFLNSNEKCEKEVTWRTLNLNLKKIEKLNEK